MDKLTDDILQMALDAGCSDAAVALCTSVENSVTALVDRIDRIHRANDCSLSLSLFSDGRYGSFSTNQIDKNSLFPFIKKAAELTRLLQVDEFRRLPDKSRYYSGDDVDLKLYDNSVRTIPIEKKKEIAISCCDKIREKVQSVECEFGDSEDYITIADTQGFKGTLERTTFTVSTECSLADKDGRRPESYWYDSTIVFKDLDYEHCAEIALSRGLESLGARKIKSGKYDIVIENTVASKMVAPIMKALMGSSIQQGRSFLKDSIGKNIFPESLSICDKPHKIGHFGARMFDSEGVATIERPIVQAGVPQLYFLNTYYAAKMGMEPTADNFSILEMEPNVTTGLDGIMERCGKGILITGFNGGNHNATTGDFSFGIKGFYFEKGKKSYPVREMNLTGNLIDLWNNISFIGNDPLSLSRVRIPSLAFKNQYVSGL